jgi:hypothetical protein
VGCGGHQAWLCCANLTSKRFNSRNSSYRRALAVIVKNRTSMISDKINIEKSILKARLITKSWFIERILNCLFYFILLVSFPLAAGLFLLAQYKNNGSIIYATLLLLITLIYSAILLYSFININNLKRIHGISKDQNKEFIREIFENLELQIIKQENELTVCKYSSNSLRQITVLYDNLDVLINSTTYALYDYKSPFHWFIDRKIENALIEKLEAKIKTTNR